MDRPYTKDQGDPRIPVQLYRRLANGDLVPADESYPFSMQGSITVISVVPVIDTSIYAAGDLLFDATAIAAAVLSVGDGCLIDSITLIDKDAQAAAIDLYVSQGNTTLGTLNAAPSISAANYVANQSRLLAQIGTGDWTTIKSGLKQATRSALALEMKAGAAATSLYISGIVQGTPTFTNAANLSLLVGIIRQ